MLLYDLIWSEQKLFARTNIQNTLQIKIKNQKAKYSNAKKALKKGHNSTPQLALTAVPQHHFPPCPQLSHLNMANYLLPGNPQLYQFAEMTELYAALK